VSLRTTPNESAPHWWTEAITLVSVDHVPNEMYDNVRPHFTEKELAGTFELGRPHDNEDPSEAAPARPAAE
jgi:hypothetical protein